MRQMQVAFVFLLRAIYTKVVERGREKESQGTFFSICSTMSIESLVSACLALRHAPNSGASHRDLRICI